MLFFDCDNAAEGKKSLRQKAFARSSSGWQKVPIRTPKPALSAVRENALLLHRPLSVY